MALAPWPSSPVALANATAQLAAALDLGATDDAGLVQRLGAMAAARVEKEAPGAPQAVKDEAVIRFAGYMHQADYGTVESESMGPGSVNYTRNHAPAFRLCGAMALVSPWKVRRAGVIG